MPSGKTHLAIELLLFPFALTLFYITLSHEWNDLGLFVVSYLVSSLWLSPDLDLKRNNALRRWGLFRWIWWPYSQLFKHRGLSHHILWGPLSRIVYLGILVGGILYFFVVQNVIQAETLSAFLAKKALFITLLGLYMPNIIHIVVDGMPFLRLKIRKNQK